MKRFFYDVASATFVQHDCKGQDFDRLEDARELAELIALDLECTVAADFIGAEVRVFNTKGDRLFSVPIGGVRAIAA